MAQPERGGRGQGWRIPRLWPGETVVCIASGPSLTDADCERVRGYRTIAVNRAWEKAGHAAVLYAADTKWWRLARNAPGFQGIKLCAQAIEFRDVTRIRVLPKRPGLSLDPDAVHHGGNSGYQALNLAVLFGARRVVLLGYDMKCGPAGEKHWHPDHPGNNPSAACLEKWRASFETTIPDLQRAGVEVVNCTRDTALTCFPKMTLEAL